MVTTVHVIANLSNAVKNRTYLHRMYFRGNLHVVFTPQGLLAQAIMLMSTVPQTSGDVKLQCHYFVSEESYNIVCHVIEVAWINIGSI